MEVTYSLTREDYWQFNRFLLKRRRSYYWSPIVGGSVAAATCLLLRASDSGTPLLPWAAGFAVVAAAGVGAGWVLLGRRYLLRRAVRRLPAEDGSTLAKRTLRIDPGGIHFSSATGEGVIWWSGVVEITEDQAYLYMFTDKVCAIIVPKRLFADSAVWKDFVETARSYWEQRKRSAGSE
ncbi:MAG: YcxB family protein [Terriglobia bacterium]